MYDGFSKFPGFTAVKQVGLYVGTEDPYFGIIRVRKLVHLVGFIIRIYHDTVT